MRKISDIFISYKLVPSFGFLALCVGADEYAKVMRQLNIKGAVFGSQRYVAWVETFTRNEAKPAYVVCCDPKWMPKDRLEAHLTLVHEAVHVWQKICTDIGEDAPSKEFEAYSIEHISRALCRAYDARKGRKR